MNKISNEHISFMLQKYAVSRNIDPKNIAIISGVSFDQGGSVIKKSHKVLFSFTNEDDLVKKLEEKPRILTIERVRRFLSVFIIISTGGMVSSLLIRNDNYWKLILCLILIALSLLLTVFNKEK
jgi:hypothetical protein